MLLSDRDIAEEMLLGNIIIDPYEARYMQPASYDVHLAQELLIPAGQPMRYDAPRGISQIPARAYNAGLAFDPSEDEQPLERYLIAERESGFNIWLPPGGVALGCTYELLTLHPESRIAADIAGCSSLGRWWLFVHVTAGFIDPGWSGRLTLELYNASPWWLRLWAGMRIAQLRFYELRTKPQRSYLDTGHYAGATTVLPAEYHG